MSEHPRRLPGVEITPAADGFLACIPGSTPVTWLNRTGRLVLGLCTGVNDEALIARALMDAFDLGAPPIRTVRGAIADLVAAGLVTPSTHAPTQEVSLTIAVWAPGQSTDAQVTAGVQALLAETAEAGITASLTLDYDRSMRGARNRAATAVVSEGAATHALFLDASPAAIEAVRASTLDRLVTSGHEVIGIPVPIGPIAWDKARIAAAALPGITDDELAAFARGYDVSFASEPDPRSSRDGFLPGRHCGSGALLVARSALERIAGSGGVNRHRGSVQHGALTVAPSWGFFDPGLSADGIDIDEDFAFCERLRASGGSLMIDITGGFGDCLAVTTRLQARRG